MLNLTRSGNGYGPNPLSYSEIKAYLDLMGPPLLPVDIFVDMLLGMDRAYLKLVVDKQKREMKARGGRKT